MYTRSLKDLKNVIDAATLIGKPLDFSAKRKSPYTGRDISIEITYHPLKNVKEDIYPYWLLEMREEETFRTVMVDKSNLRLVRDIYNGFVNQGKDESFLDNSLDKLMASQELTKNKN